MTHQLTHAEQVQLENEMLERQTAEDVAQFLKEEKEGKKSFTMMDASGGAFGKGVLYVLGAVSLIGIFSSVAKSSAAYRPVEEPVAAVQQQVQQKPVSPYSFTVQQTR